MCAKFSEQPASHCLSVVNPVSDRSKFSRVGGFSRAGACALVICLSSWLPPLAAQTPSAVVPAAANSAQSAAPAAQPDLLLPAGLPAPVPPTLNASSWLLFDMSLNKILTSEKAYERLEPASLTKLMTAYLTFAAIKQKTLSLEQTLPVSEKAWRTGGSKMFIQVNTQVAVEDLIKGMIVQSGNDACVTLAEGIAGSEENFAQMMNREAQRLGMKSSQFKNATGLPDVEHYTTAYDLSLLATALVRDFPQEYQRYYSLKEFRYNNITQPNRNRLLWIDSTVDGMKTGYTKAAGFCLVSSANRQGRRLVSVVLGTDSGSRRVNESLKLLNWGFSSFDHVVLVKPEDVLDTLRVWKSDIQSLPVKVAEPMSVVLPKGYGGKVKHTFVPVGKLVAPIAKGQTLGVVKVEVDGKVVAENPVPALQDIAVGGLWRRFIDSIMLWFN